MAAPKFKSQVFLLKLSVGKNVTCYDLATQKVSRFRKLSSYQPWLEDSFLVPFPTALKRVLRLTRLASLLAGICSAQICPIVRFKRRLTWKWEKRKYPKKRPHRPIFSRWAWTHIETCRGLTNPCSLVSVRKHTPAHLNWQIQYFQICHDSTTQHTVAEKSNFLEVT